jgi:hypothetical protein
MSTLIPAALALLGLGMFAGSLWLQEAEARSRMRRDAVPVAAPVVDELEEEAVTEPVLSQYPVISH